MLKVIRFFTLLFMSTLCIASTSYVAPTSIPTTQSERLQYVEQFSKKEKDKPYLLTKIALLAEDDSTSLDDVLEVVNLAERLSKENPDDMELLSAFGSVTSYLSIFYKDNLGKMNFYSRKGTRMMDRAVKKAPNNLGARLQRGIASAAMPKFLNRAHLAVNDLSLVNENIGKTNGISFNSMVEFYLAMALSKSSEVKQAKGILNAIVQRKEAVWSARAQAMLKDF
ncbi:MAG: hypothetical protein OQK51_19190 [Kangiellaceae bacterium]|nr:hypothetical protein [Kangiellaceae bacterium]